MTDETKEPFRETPEEVAARLEVDPSNGLCGEQIEIHRKTYGTNEFTKGKKTSVLRRIYGSALD